MKTITVRLPDPVAAEIEAEAHARRIPKSDVMRERLERAKKPEKPAPLEAIADLIGAADEGPSDLGARTKHYLKKKGYGRNRADR